MKTLPTPYLWVSFRISETKNQKEDKNKYMYVERIKNMTKQENNSGKGENK